MHRLFTCAASILVAGGLLLVVLGLLAPGATAHAGTLTVRFVAADGNCGSNSPCYDTIQAAVDEAAAGDIVRVAGGRYTGVSARGGATQLVYLDRSLMIQGSYDPLLWTVDPANHPTILDAEGQGRVLYVTGVVSPVLDGLHIVNGVGANGGGLYGEDAALTLSNSHVYSNHTNGLGGGIYLERSQATLSGNHIYTNTTGANGRGGGLALVDSPATVTENVIEQNAAHVGGGVLVNSTRTGRGAVLRDNTIRDNVAFDVSQNGYTFDGAGGGLELSSYVTDTVEGNTLSGNLAKWGGAIHAYGTTATIRGNTIQQNRAPTHGGGLYLQGGQITLEENDILSNTTENFGGGLMILGDNSVVRANTFRGNSTVWCGGGMYAGGGGLFDGNVFLANTSTQQGGGAFVNHATGAHFLNNVFAENSAAEGGGLYLWGSDLRLDHTTLARNSSGDGRAVFIDKYPGRVSPEEPTIYTSTIVFSNTIVAGHAIGFHATPDNSLTVDGVLWWETPTHFQTSGAQLAVHDEFSGDPLFQADGYHISAYSAARYKVDGGLDHDVDGQLRDWATQDLGADEFVPVAAITPETGGSVIYTNTQAGVTMTVGLPPGAISFTTGLMFSPFPPLPPGVMDSPFGRFVAVGPPFRLDPFTLVPGKPVTNPHNPPLGNPAAPIQFTKPATVTVNYDLDLLKRLRDAMEQLELQLLQIIGGEKSSPPQDPACGAPAHDLTARTLAVPICDTGIMTGTQAAGMMLRLYTVDAPGAPGLFVFGVEVAGDTLYLPLVQR